MLRIELLGPLVVSDAEGRDRTPGGGRERNGLATLAVVSPESLSTERLAAELYREGGTADPRNAVQAMVSRLRKALGRSAGCLETTVNGYRLVDVTVDVDEAEALLREASLGDDLKGAVDRLDQARRLWRGSSFDGLDGELIEAERLRIDGLLHDVEDGLLVRRVRVGSSPGDDGRHRRDLIGDLEAAVRHQPLREQRWELLMLVLYQMGRQADALRAFQRARGLLAEHLGLEPGPSLIELERRILAHDPGLDPQPDSEQDRPSDGLAEQSDSVEFERGPQLPSGTLSVLLSDVVGSVRRWEDDPADTASVIDNVRRLWSEAVTSGGGVAVVGGPRTSGEGIMAIFETAEQAIRAAARAMADQAGLDLATRAAIHTGTLEPTDHGDYRGPVVNRCARILELAQGGQILVSGSTAELARGHLTADPPAETDPVVGGTADQIGAGLGVRELGSHWLRDVPEPMNLWQVTGPALPSTFPPLASADRTSLPRLRGALLGRDRLLERLSELVADEPLVTLLGPGGIGKTSMALAVGWSVIGGRSVCFVDLARVDDPAVVADRLVEAAVPGHDDPRPAAARLAERLSSSTDLVIIDNAEHVIDAVTDIVDAVLTSRLKGSFLVTSRHPLGLTDETIVGVPPLEVPDDSDDLDATGRSPAVTLFVERARALQPGFVVSDGLLPVVAHICRRLDGMPLAIELAAGRASLLSIDDIAARLDDQLRLLRQVRSQRDRRHRSLEAVVGWSVDQLSTEAREVFNRLSVMAGSFGLDGLAGLLEHCDLTHIDELEAVDELHSASLITVEHGGSRFRMLEPIRQFAAAELTRRGLEPASRRAHAQWITEVAADAHRRRDRSRAEARKRLDAESDQVLAALNWIADAGQADLAGDLAYPVGWWFLSGDARAGEKALGRLLDVVDRAVDPLGWAKVVLGLGMASAAHPGSAVAGQSIEALKIFDDHDHPDRALVRLAAVFAQTGGGDLELPLQLLAEADRMTSADDLFARALVDMSTMIVNSIVLGLEPSGADGSAAVQRGTRAMATFREFGETWALGTTLSEMGRLHQRLGDLESAEACYLESLELFDGDDNHGSHYVLTELARLAADRGQFGRADRLNAEALRIAEADGYDGCVALALAGMAYTAVARDAIDQAAELYRQAIALSSDTIIELGRTEWLEALDRLVGPGPDSPSEA